MSSDCVYICGCARSCEIFLDKVFLNIHNISELYKDFVIIIAYDVSSDNTLDKLLEHQSKYGETKMKILNNKNQLSTTRTENISNARNDILKEIRRINNPMFTHMIMLDLDDACSSPMNMDVLKQTLNRTDWDMISFNREDYYDIWALSINPYMYSCWHFYGDTMEYIAIMKKYIEDKLLKLSPDELLECSSAFNGIAIYKLASFENCNYSWSLTKNIRLIKYLYPTIIQKNTHLGEHYKNTTIGYNADCEHRGFHMSAILLNKAKIRISPLDLFK